MLAHTDHPEENEERHMCKSKLGEKVVHDVRIICKLHHHEAVVSRQIDAILQHHDGHQP